MISLRAAVAADAAAMTDLVFRAKAANGYDRAFMEACREELRVTPDRLNDARHWVAEDAGQIVGCIALALAHKDAGEVTTMFVDPARQGQGVGRCLWQHMLAVAKAEQLTQLHLDADPFAVPFYRAMGCVTVGEAPSGSIPGRVLPVMALFLNAPSNPA